jgi:hypothetical protein
MLQEGKAGISSALSGNTLLRILDQECQTSVWKQISMHTSYLIKMYLHYVQTIVINNKL